MVKHDVYLSISLQDKHGTNDVANYTQMTSCILYPNNPNFDYKQKTFDTPITLPTENKVETTGPRLGDPSVSPGTMCLPQTGRKTQQIWAQTW